MIAQESMLYFCKPFLLSSCVYHVGEALWRVNTQGTACRLFSYAYCSLLCHAQWTL